MPSSTNLTEARIESADSQGGTVVSLIPEIERAVTGALPGSKIRHEFTPDNAGENLVASARPRSKLAQLVDGGTQYRLDAADVLAEIAAWSYSDGQTLVDELHHRDIVSSGDRCFEVSLKNEPMLVVATGFFVQSEDVGVLCFRGTEPVSAINWLTDANVEPKPFLAMGRVHGGFCRNVRALWNDIQDRVEKARARGLKALYITGHSLGGAMAVVAAATIFAPDGRYAAWRNLVRGVYTFGQPMVGDKAFAASCDKEFGPIHFRHVYAQDLVPRMPPIIAGVFRHSGSEYTGSRDGWLPRDRAVAQAISVAAIPIGFLAWVFKQVPVLHSVSLPYSINDHSPNSYLEAFRAYQGP